MQDINVGRVVIFSTLAEAIASKRLLFINELAVVAGDVTRTKRGSGIENNANAGLIFSALPWTKSERNVISELDVTGTLTAAQVFGGIVASLSAAAVSATLPLATDLVALLGAKQGTQLDFTVDNSAGANTVTVVVNTGITAATAVITGGATLTVASGKVGFFRLYFISTTAAILYRLA